MKELIKGFVVLGGGLFFIACWVGAICFLAESFAEAVKDSEKR